MMKQAYVLQNDNAISHKAPIVQKWKVDHAIGTIDWLVKESPDLFIVENF